MPDGWRCPECGLILAPSVTEHRCDPPSAGTLAPVIWPSGSGGASAATFPPGTTVTVTNSGTGNLSSADVTELTQAVQQQLLKQAQRSRRWPGSAA